MIKGGCVFSGGNLTVDVNESGVLSPHLGLLAITVMRMEVPITPKLDCCFRVSQNFKMQNKKIVSLARQLNGDNKFVYKNWQFPVKLTCLPFAPCSKLSSHNRLNALLSLKVAI